MIILTGYTNNLDTLNLTKIADNIVFFFFVFFFFVFFFSFVRETTQNAIKIVSIPKTKYSPLCFRVIVLCWRIKPIKDR